MSCEFSVYLQNKYLKKQILKLKKRINTASLNRNLLLMGQLYIIGTTEFNMFLNQVLRILFKHWTIDMQ